MHKLEEKKHDSDEGCLSAMKGLREYFLPFG